VSNIPRARELLFALAGRLRNGDTTVTEAAGEIVSIIQGYMYRPSPARRAPTQSHTPNADDRAKMREDARNNPTIPLREIGRQHGVDGGRCQRRLGATTSPPRNRAGD
jgi:hypothetical protein